jgi:hypothetical protein
MSDILLSPVFSWWGAALLVLLMFVAVFWSTRTGLKLRERRLWLGALRFGTVFVLLVVLIQPQRKVDEVTVIKPQLAVLVDDSESMKDQVDPQQSTRAERVKKWMESEAMQRARESFDVRLFRFDSKLTEMPGGESEIGFAGVSSNIIAAVQQIRDRFVGQSLAAVLLLSDGLDSSGLGSSMSLAAGVPIHTFELEKEFVLPEKARKVSLSALDAPGRVVAGWDAEVRASVSAVGMSGKTVSVELWRSGQKEAESTVTFNEDDQSRPVVFALPTSEPGMIPFELRIEDPAADAESKKRPFLVEVVAPGKRILYVQNGFNFEFKFLRRAITGDRNLQLQTFVRTGEGRLVSIGGGSGQKLELTQAGLAPYALVIIGDLPPESLSPEQGAALKEYVNRGGSLILLGGMNGFSSKKIAESPLSEISPAVLPADYREGRFPSRMTEAGLRHPVLGALFTEVKQFPAVLSANVSRSIAAGAEVLMEAEIAGQRTPLLVSARSGGGRVVAFMSDSLWRWRMGVLTGTPGKSYYDVFWGQLIEWVIPKADEKVGSAKLEIFTERSSYLMGERPEVRAIFDPGSAGGKLPATLPLKVKTPDGKEFDYAMKPGQFTASSGKSVSGYTVKVEPNVAGIFLAQSSWGSGKEKLSAESRFSVSEPLPEKAGKPIDRVFLGKVAEQTGGQFFSFEQADSWRERVSGKEQQVARARLLDLWNHPVLLSMLLMLLSADWFMRKRWNLP